jgi:acetyl-CoA C-acetyltransferase
MTHSNPDISLEIRGNGDEIAVIRLTRPAKRNALNDGLILALRNMLETLPATVRAAVIDGDGEHFCSGLDLSELKERDAGQGMHHSRMWHSALELVQFGPVPVEFKDFLIEALTDTAGPVTMIETAENLAKKYGITRADVDAYAALSFERALKAQADGFLAGEIVPVTSEKFELDGYATRGIQLPRKVAQLDRDTHPRPSPIEALAGLRTVYPGGVQTAGNSSALVDGAVGALVASGAYVQKNGLKPLARLRGAAAAGVPPELMGIGPAPAIRALLERCGLQLSDIGLFEINEAQGAQTIAVERELGLDRDKLNVNGGAIALGHPLAATGVRLTITLARELRRRGLRYGISSACVGGGQGMALLIENTEYLKD